MLTIYHFEVEPRSRLISGSRILTELGKTLPPVASRGLDSRSSLDLDLDLESRYHCVWLTNCCLNTMLRLAYIRNV